MKPVVLRWWLLWLSGWLLLMVVSQSLLPLMPIDETRYISVAWEMWLRNDFLVPHLNGETYSHKPPLLFWLINLGWWVYGVNEWWPRLVPGLFALGSFWLTQRSAYLLWPQRIKVAFWAPTILLGSLYWGLFMPRLMFDMMLLAFRTDQTRISTFLRGWNPDRRTAVLRLTPEALPTRKASTGSGTFGWSVHVSELFFGRPPRHCLLASLGSSGTPLLMPSL